MWGGGGGRGDVLLQLNNTDRLFPDCDIICFEIFILGVFTDRLSLEDDPVTHYKSCELLEGPAVD